MDNTPGECWLTRNAGLRKMIKDYEGVSGHLIPEEGKKLYLLAQIELTRMEQSARESRNMGHKLAG